MTRQMVIGFIAALIVFVAICVAFVPKAEAAPLSASTYGISSVPCVTDVEHLDKDRFLIEVTVTGHTDGKNLSVKRAGKKVKVYKIDQHTWSFEAKKGKTYTIGFNGKAVDFKVRRA